MNKKLLKIKPYTQGEQPNFKKNIKLNTNENPYHTDIKIIKNIIKEINFFGNNFKFYPEINSKIIKKEISLNYNIKDKEIFVGNGSDDVLANIFLTFFKNNKILYLIDLTYSFYESYIKLYKIKYKIIKINKNFSITLKKIKKNKNNIILNNPNAPTGKFISNLEIKIIVKKIKSIIVIDETYIDFENITLIKTIKKSKNLIITQTASKSKSLAGLRIGWAISNEKLIKEMEITKNCLNSYPINIVSQTSLKNINFFNIYFKKNIIKIRKNKYFLKNKLKESGFKIIKSETNFIMVTNKKININKLLKYLSKKNIFVRKFEIPKVENFLRISIGKIKECKILIKNIKKYLSNFE